MRDTKHWQSVVYFMTSLSLQGEEAKERWGRAEECVGLSEEVGNRGGIINANVLGRRQKQMEESQATAHPSLLTPTVRAVIEGPRDWATLLSIAEFTKCISVQLLLRYFHKISYCFQSP